MIYWYTIILYIGMSIIKNFMYAIPLQKKGSI